VLSDVPQIWGPAGASRSAAWRLEADHSQFRLVTEDGHELFAGDQVAQLGVSRWWFGRSLIVRGTPTRRLRGVRREDVAPIRSAINWHAARASVKSTLDRAREFQAQWSTLLAHHLVEQPWIPYDRASRVLDLRPAAEELAHLRDLPTDGLLTAEERDALDLAARDPIAATKAANDRILQAELTERASFFAGVERQPLTQEQSLAVVAFDTRVRVIAAAGSGKTSVMVARAAYAIARGFVPPNRILMLAFNADAATELQARVSARLTALGRGMQWKRSVHRRFGTPLIETTWHEIVNLGGFTALADQLQRHGLTLDWNPDRPTPGAEPVTHERMARLVRTFMSHVKAGSLSHIDLATQLAERPNRRSRLFVELFWQIYDRWQKDLAEIGATTSTT